MNVNKQKKKRKVDLRRNSPAAEKTLQRKRLSKKVQTNEPSQKQHNNHTPKINPEDTDIERPEPNRPRNKRTQPNPGRIQPTQTPSTSINHVWASKEQAGDPETVAAPTHTEIAPIPPEHHRPSPAPHAHPPLPQHGLRRTSLGGGGKPDSGTRACHYRAIWTVDTHARSTRGPYNHLHRSS